MDSEDVCTQTLGSSFTGSPSVTSVQLPESSMQASSEVCKDGTCDDQPESPMKTKLPNRCARSNLSGLSNDQPAQPEEQLCHSRTVSVNGNGVIQLIPCQQTYQTITMTNTGNLCPGTPMMQYVVHSRDGTQTYIMPDDKVVLEATTGDMSAYQICSPTSGLSHDISSSPGSLPSPQQLSEEATRKRELRLLKNREAARECRRKKKEYVKCLENRVAVLEKQNKTLIEELKALKVLVAAKECRRRKKEYELHLETRLIMLENQNKRLTKELEYFKNVYTGRPKSC